MGIFDVFSGKTAHLNNVILPAVERFVRSGLTQEENPYARFLYAKLLQRIYEGIKDLFKLNPFFKSHLKYINPRGADQFVASIASVCVIGFLIDDYMLHRDVTSTPGDFASAMESSFLQYLDEEQNRLYMSLRDNYIQIRNEKDAHKQLFNQWYNFFCNHVLGLSSQPDDDSWKGLHVWLFGVQTLFRKDMIDLYIR